MIFITGGITSPEHRAFFAEHELPCLDKPVDLEALDRRIAAIAPPGGAPLPLARPHVSNGTRNSGGPEG